MRPNTRTFNVVLNALARVEGGDGGVRASELLGRLVELGSSDDDGPRPDVISYNTVLAAWSKIAGVRPGESPSAGEGGAQKRKGVVGEFAAHEALRLLDEIEGRYLQSLERKTHGRSLAVKPDVISYNTTIAAFANAAQHCEDGTPNAHGTEGGRDTLPNDRIGHRTRCLQLQWRTFGVGPLLGGSAPLEARRNNPPVDEGAYHSKLVDGRYRLRPCRWRAQGRGSVAGNGGERRWFVLAKQRPPYANDTICCFVQ